MDSRQSDYPQSDQASAAQYPQGQDPRSANFSSSATPTSEYGLNPSSARSGSFPDYIQRTPYHQSSAPSANAGGMAQTSPSMPLSPDGQQNHHHNHPHSMKSDSSVPIDASIAAAASPTYPQHQQYSPYAQQHDMSHYPPHPATPMYAQRPDWPGHYPGGPPMPYGHAPGSSGPPQPAMVSPVARPPAGGHPLSTVYSFVPIPGAQQHKRPRRRYEEIERMYKCGWNGCEKAYGTLNHLNAHVTMQSHGTKRTPEEFKEIRKEWKAKKKEEEAARKADEERQRAADGRNAPEHAPENAAYGGMRSQMPAQPPMGGPGPHLPPIGYAPASGGQAPQYGTQSPGTIDGMTQYATNGHVYSHANNNGNNSYPQSPYGQNNQMYQQNPDNPPSNFQQ